MELSPYLRLASTTTLGLALSLALVACGDDGGGDDGDGDGTVNAGCNPLGSPELTGAGCILPWPSSVYEKDDSAAATGRRLDIPEGVLPKNADNKRPNPAKYNAMDGWSANIPLLMAWPTGFDPAGLVGESEIERSLTDSSPTVLVDVETGERIPHFAEADLQANNGRDVPVAEVALIIRVAVRLQPGHTYAVGVKNTLKAPGGGELPRSAGFQSLVDGTAGDNPRLEAVRPRYAAIFEKLAAAGAPKENLVIAWDFTVRSDAPVYADLVDGRDAMMAAIGDGSGFAMTIEMDGPAGNPEETLRVVRGRFELPSLLSGDGGDEAVLARDGNGKVTTNGTITAPFVVVIPKCAEDPANLPLPMVVYGHGLLGSIDETGGGYLRYFAQRTCTAIIGTNWRGMSSDDITAVALGLNDLDRIDLVMEKLVHGMNQFVALAALARLKWADDPLFQLGGEPLLDKTKQHYYGISQGGIFGGTYLAIDPFVTRGVLGVGAANYSYIIERSTNWETYRIFMYNAYTDSALDPQILLTLAQTRWDLTDPITHISHLTGDVEPPYPGTPEKQVLMQIAVGDSQVANIGADLWARTAGVKILAPALVTPFLLEAAPGPLSSAMSYWDEHRDPDPPGGNYTAEDNGTHGSLRRRDSVIDQIANFYENGTIIQTCTSGGEPAACDCPKNATGDATCGPAAF